MNDFLRNNTKIACTGYEDKLISYFNNDKKKNTSSRDESFKTDYGKDKKRKSAIIKSERMLECSSVETNKQFS